MSKKNPRQVGEEKVETKKEVQGVACETEYTGRNPDSLMCADI